MLDSYINGKVERISPEAPIPVVKYVDETDVAGGSANIARNLNTMGGKVLLTGVIGLDEWATRLKTCLTSTIDCAGIFTVADRPTTLKQRIVSGNHQFLRVDKEVTDPIPTETERAIITFLQANLKDCDGVIVGDYAKGVITPNLAREIVLLSQQYSKPLLVDTKPKNIAYFKGAHVLKPNLKEAREMTGKSDPFEAGRIMVKMYESNIIMTLGKDGCTIFEKDGKEAHLPGKQIPVSNVNGAGDTFGAACILALASGADIKTAARIANQAASIVVQKPGTATVSLHEIQSFLRSQISSMLNKRILGNKFDDGKT